MTVAETFADMQAVLGHLVPEFELLAENDLDDYVLSSIAVSDGQLFLRTTTHLYAIGERASSGR